MGGRGLGRCGECGEQEARYRCPRCRAPYCSAACCAAHRAGCVAPALASAGDSNAGAVRTSAGADGPVGAAAAVLPPPRLPTILRTKEEQEEEAYRLTQAQIDRFWASPELRVELKKERIRDIITLVDCGKLGCAHARKTPGGRTCPPPPKPQIRSTRHHPCALPALFCLRPRAPRIVIFGGGLTPLPCALFAGWRRRRSKTLTFSASC